MSKIKNNPIMKGASGMLGGVVVYREHRGTLVMSNRPKTRDTLTAQQSLAKSRFLRAVQYAKKQIADPVTKAEYQPNSQSRFTSAYSAALADYLGSPVINTIDTSKYGGVINDTIVVNTTDNFKVTLVHVAIFTTNGILIEEGDATLVQDSIEEYAYITTKANSTLTGTKVVATVRDKPGNTTILEKVL